MSDTTYRKLMDQARTKNPWNITGVYIEVGAALLFVFVAGFIFVNTTHAWPEGLLNIPGGIFVLGCLLGFIHNRDKNGNNRRMILTLADELKEAKHKINELESKPKEVV